MLDKTTVLSIVKLDRKLRKLGQIANRQQRLRHLCLPASGLVGGKGVQQSGAASHMSGIRSCPCSSVFKAAQLLTVRRECLRTHPSGGACGTEVERKCFSSLRRHLSSLLCSFSPLGSVSLSLRTTRARAASNLLVNCPN